MWLDPQDVFLGIVDAEGNLIKVDHKSWNPDECAFLSDQARQELTKSIASLVKEHSLHRLPLRLCLDDSLCVTRVVTGDKDDVERELENIQVRSQLYLSLGLGDKLTGNVKVTRDGDAEYALTSVVNLQAIRMIQDVLRGLRIRLSSIEPVALSITRALGLLGLDSTEPILFASIGKKRCDLGITRSGHLMLSYPISGTEGPIAIGKQISSHMKRLKRFCQRFRLQEGSNLERIYIFGNDDAVEKLTGAIDQEGNRIRVDRVELPEVLRPLEIPSIPRAALLALWSCGQYRSDRSDCLPPPDLYRQLESIQLRPLRERLFGAMWPSAVAAIIVAALSIGQWTNRLQLAAKIDELSDITVEISMMEQELGVWASKERSLQAYLTLERRLGDRSWVDLVQAIAPCLPPNARLDSLSLSDATTINLRGTMMEGDRTYEMLGALKQLPMIGEVAVESVSSMGVASLEQFQFEVKCRLLERRETSPTTLVQKREKVAAETH